MYVYVYRFILDAQQGARAPCHAPPLNIDFRLPTNDLSHPITDFSSPFTDYRLPINAFRCPIINIKPKLNTLLPF